MRVNLFGDSPIIATLKTQLLREGYVVSERFPTYTIELAKGYAETEGGKITDGKLQIWSSYGSLEQRLLLRLCELTKEPLMLLRAKSEFEIKIAVPQREEYNISHAVLRALNELAHVKVSWLKRWLQK
jgi:hypothetical protein